MTNEVNFSGSLKLGGIPQWIYIRGKDRKNPLLLFLHGGPGFCESQFAHLHLSHMEPFFTVVHWDQRGANRSYSDKIPKSSMSMEQFSKDTIELSQYLLKEFNKTQLILVGHSFGSMLAIKATSLAPELFSYLFLLGTTVGGTRGDVISYNSCVELARRKGLNETLEDLESLGSPPFDHFTDNIFSAVKWSMGGNFSKKFGKAEKMVASGNQLFVPVVDFRNIATFSASSLYDELQNWQVLDQVKEINVPSCMITGRDDLMTPPIQAEEVITSGIFKKKKELIIFENCAHWPHHEYPAELVTIIKERISETQIESKN